MPKRRRFNHGDAEYRMHRAHERLETDAPKCLICPVTDHRCSEQHHVAGRYYSNETAIFCSNDHRRLSDLALDHPPKIEGCTSPLEVIGHWLLGLADIATIASEKDYAGQLKDFLVYLAQKLRVFGMQLIDEARASSGTPKPE